MTFIRDLINKPKLWIVILITFGLTQESPIAPQIANGFSTANNIANSIKNPNQFSINQSISFMTSSTNGMSMSIGMFTNNFQYKISDQMDINSNIHLISPMVKTSYDQQPFDIKYDVELDYRISDSFTFNIMLSNYNKYNNHFYQNRYRETYLSE